MEKNPVSEIESAVKEIGDYQYSLWFFRFCIFLFVVLVVTSRNIILESALYAVFMSVLFISGLGLAFIGMRKDKAEIKAQETLILGLLSQVDEETDQSRVSFTARRYVSYLKKNDAQRRKPRSAMLAGIIGE